MTKEKINAICNAMASMFSCYEKYLYSNSWIEEIAYLSRVYAELFNIELIILSPPENAKKNGGIVGVNYKKEVVE